MSEITVKQRLVSFLTYKKISQGKFEKLVGLSNGYVNNISRGLGADKLQKIIGVFPDLNSNWLLTGEGEMLKESKSYANSININGSTVKDNFIQSGTGNKFSGNITRSPDTQKEADLLKETEALLKEIEYLNSLLAEKDKQIDAQKLIIELLMKNKN